MRSDRPFHLIRGLVAASLLSLVVPILPMASAAPLESVSASGEPPTTNSTTSWVVAFTNPTAIPTGGDIRVVFPSQLTLLAGGNCTLNVNSLEVTGENGSLSGSEAICELGNNSIPAYSGVSLTWTNVRNPTTAQTTGTFTIQTRDAADVVIDSNTTYTGVVTPSVLQSFTGNATNQTSGATTKWRFTFRTVNFVAATGDVRIVFPAGFQTSSGAATQCDFLDKVSENATVVSATEVICNLNGASFLVGELVTLDVTNIRNPSTVQQTGLFTVQTRREDDQVHDHHISFQTAINSSPLVGMDILAPSQTAGSTETWFFNFTTTNAIAAQGDIRVVFPTGFMASSGGTSACAITGKTGITTEIYSSTVVICNLNAAAPLAANEFVRLSISKIRNPTTSRLTNTFLIETRDTANAVVDASLDRRESISTHPFMATPAQSSPNLAGGAVNDHTFTFKPFNAWNSNGQFRVIFPLGYTFNANSLDTQATFLSGGSGFFTAPSINGTTLTFSRVGGSTIASGATVSVKVTAVKNRETAGSTMSFYIATADNTGAEQDSGFAPGIVLTPAPTTSTSTTTTKTTKTTTTGSETNATTNETDEGEVGGGGKKGFLPSIASTTALVVATATVLFLRRRE